MSIGQDRLEVIGLILKSVQGMLLDDILAFKDLAFGEEDEWRMIVRPRLFVLQGRDAAAKLLPSGIFGRLAEFWCPTSNSCH